MGSRYNSDIGQAAAEEVCVSVVAVCYLLYRNRYMTQTNVPHLVLVLVVLVNRSCKERTSTFYSEETDSTCAFGVVDETLAIHIILRCFAIVAVSALCLIAVGATVAAIATTVTCG